MPPAKTKVAILGGGAGALAAAYGLSATQELRDRYEVTVHTLGWRLGGKGASGRNRAVHDRIEEHGLHIWFGFYDNAFELMKDCYAAMGRPAEAPLRHWDDAFKPAREIVLCDEWEGGWSCHTYKLPPNPLEPGRDIDPRDIGPAEILAGIVDVLEEHMNPLENAVGKVMSWITHNALKSAIHTASTSVGARAAYKVAVEVLSRFDELVWERFAEGRLDHGLVRRSATLLDFWAALLRGIVDDDLIEEGFGTINDVDLRKWLGRHGARPETLESPFMRGFYDLVFAYEGGDRGRPNLAAGKAVQAMLRIGLTYKGAVMWKMQAGMGDVVFAPLYLVLKQRGVTFEFFHRVERLGLSGALVDEIEVRPQVRLRGDAYEPLFDVDGLPCWPSEPDWDQIEGGDPGVNLELGGHAPGAPRAVTLKRGRDFDEVVLGIPLGALKDICGELADANAAFADMLEHIPTVATQAAQVWLARPPDAEWGDGTGEIMGSYVTPLDTCCDMTHLVVRERWPGRADGMWIAYVCGAMDEPASGRTQAQADARARTDALDYLREHAGFLWPQATDADGCFDWALLADPDGRSGEERFEAQYWRANIHGGERYVLTTAGSVGYRLWPGDSGFDNLYLAGDWTRNGIDGGSVEGAVTSGLLASQALSGAPATIAGLSGWLVDS